jgi:hypothetical protein
MEQMMKCLLVKMEAEMETERKNIQEKIGYNQDRMEARTNINHEETKAEMKTQFGSLSSKTDSYLEEAKGDECILRSIKGLSR